MYKFFQIMFVLSIIGLICNLVLIYVNKGQGVGDLSRAVLMLITTVSFYTLMRINKQKNRRK